MLGKKAFVPASNKENDLGPLNMLRKAQKSRKEQLERKLSSRNIGDMNLKENISINKDFNKEEKVAPIKQVSKITAEPQPSKDIEKEKQKETQKEEFRYKETTRLMKFYASDLIRE